jgi:hypothetical protein
MGVRFQAAVLVLATGVLLTACSHRYGVVAKTEDKVGFAPARTGPVCLLAGDLPTGTDAQQLGTIKAGKRSYGGTDEIMRAMADEARRIGADAVINMVAEQRVKGPIPWRAVAPTGTGNAVKVQGDIDCNAAGGKSL